jgi:hypothetical protein
MVFMLYAVSGVILIGQRGVSVGVVIGAAIGLVYMAMLRDIVEATWRWQALNWLDTIRHRLSQDEVVRLEKWAKKLELKVCRVSSLMAIIVTVLAFLRLPIWSVVSRVVIAVMVGTLVISHLLMARVYIRDEMVKIRHSG